VGHLDGHPPVQLAVVGQVDLAKRAPPQPPLESVPADPLGTAREAGAGLGAPRRAEIGRRVELERGAIGRRAAPRRVAAMGLAVVPEALGPVQGRRTRGAFGTGDPVGPRRQIVGRPVVVDECGRDAPGRRDTRGRPPEGNSVASPLVDWLRSFSFIVIP
jgi:hypothetical protein